MSSVRLGTIKGGHGIRGWVKVYSYTDPKEAIVQYSPWTLRRGGDQKQVDVVSGHLQGRVLLVRISGVDDRQQAETLVGYEIRADRLPALQPGEYYWHQLHGLTVRNEQQVLGEVDHLLETGANDVLVVKPTGASIDDRQRLIPYVEHSVVREVDLDTGEIWVNWDADY